MNYTGSQEPATVNCCQALTFFLISTYIFLFSVSITSQFRSVSKFHTGMQSQIVDFFNFWPVETSIVSLQINAVCQC